MEELLVELFVRLTLAVAAGLVIFSALILAVKLLMVAALIAVVVLGVRFVLSGLRGCGMRRGI